MCERLCAKPSEAGGVALALDVYYTRACHIAYTVRLLTCAIPLSLDKWSIGVVPARLALPAAEDASRYAIKGCRTSVWHVSARCCA